MKDELVDRLSTLVGILDQTAAEVEAEEAEVTQNFADAVGNTANRIRSILERIERRIQALDEYAYKFKGETGRFPTPKEQMDEMERLGYAKKGEWII